MFGTIVIKERVEVVTKDMIKNRNCRVCVLPDSVKEIDDYAFSNCKKLVKLIFKDANGKIVNNKIVKIGKHAFENTSIKQFVYSHYLITIDDDAFANTSLSLFQYYDEENVESNLKYIGYSAFEGTNIEDMVIPPSIKKFYMDKNWRSILCKDSKGNIVPGCVSYSSFNCNYPKLEEISLLGVEPNVYKMIIRNNLENLKKVYISVDKITDNFFDKFSIDASNLEFILCGESETLYSFAYSESKIIVSFHAKVKKITSDFFENIFNTELVLPEGLEEIDSLFTFHANLRRLDLPSTLKKIKYPQIAVANLPKKYSMTVSIYANLSVDSYKNLCSYLEPSSSTIIIKGNYFTEKDKIFFQDISPFGLKLEFLESETLAVEVSPYQKSIEELNKKLISLIDLMTGNLKADAQKKYNKILFDYEENRKKEESIILNGNSFFGVIDSYTNLRTELILLQNEIEWSRDAFAKLNELGSYKDLVKNLRNLKYDEIAIEKGNIDDIGTIIRTIGFQIQKLTYDEEILIVDRMQNFLNDIEEIYNTRVNNLNELESPFSPISPMLDLKENLRRLLIRLEDSLFQELLAFREAFCSHRPSNNVNSLKDNIQTINYVMCETDFNRKKRAEWKREIQFFSEWSIHDMIVQFLNGEKIEEDIQKFKERLRNDLISFVEEAIIVSNTDSYRLTKIKEVEDSYQFFTDSDINNKEIQHTVSSLIMVDIMKKFIDFSSLNSPYNLKEVLHKRVEDTLGYLKLADSCDSIDEVMKDFYRGLTDIWAQVSEIYSFQNSKVMLKKFNC